MCEASLGLTPLIYISSTLAYSARSGPTGGSGHGGARCAARPTPSVHVAGSLHTRSKLRGRKLAARHTTKKSGQPSASAPPRNRTTFAPTGRRNQGQLIGRACMPVSALSRISASEKLFFSGRGAMPVLAYPVTRVWPNFLCGFIFTTTL